MDTEPHRHDDGALPNVGTRKRRRSLTKGQKFCFVSDTPVVMPTVVGIHGFTDCSKGDVDGAPSPAMTRYHHRQILQKRRRSYIFFCCVRSQPTTSGLPLVFASSTLYFQLTFAKLSDRLSCGASSEPALTL